FTFYLPSLSLSHSHLHSLSSVLLFSSFYSSCLAIVDACVDVVTHHLDFSCRSLLVASTLIIVLSVARLLRGFCWLFVSYDHAPCRSLRPLLFITNCHYFRTHNQSRLVAIVKVHRRICRVPADRAVPAPEQSWQELRLRPSHLQIPNSDITNAR
ncbi:uncharacterized protein BO66DRAFT_419272, partial [Aspergillus aculeatinus CBS 121060]